MAEPMDKALNVVSCRTLLWILGAVTIGTALKTGLQAGHGAMWGWWLLFALLFAAFWFYAWFYCGREEVTGRRELAGTKRSGAPAAVTASAAGVGVAATAAAVSPSNTKADASSTGSSGTSQTGARKAGRWARRAASDGGAAVAAASAASGTRQSSTTGRSIGSEIDPQVAGEVPALDDASMLSADASALEDVLPPIEAQSPEGAGLAGDEPGIPPSLDDRRIQNPDIAQPRRPTEPLDEIFDDVTEASSEPVAEDSDAMVTRLGVAQPVEGRGPDQRQTSNDDKLRGASREAAARGSDSVASTDQNGGIASSDGTDTRLGVAKTVEGDGSAPRRDGDGERASGDSRDAATDQADTASSDGKERASASSKSAAAVGEDAADTDAPSDNTRVASLGGGAISAPDGDAASEGESAGDKPDVLSAARGGEADDLKQISGIGPKLEGLLHSLGFYHFDQIAAWTPENVAWVDDHLGFKGRIDRDDWIGQAKTLASGESTEFSQRVARDEVESSKKS